MTIAIGMESKSNVGLLSICAQPPTLTHTSYHPNVTFASLVCTLYPHSNHNYPLFSILLLSSSIVCTLYPHSNHNDPLFSILFICLLKNSSKIDDRHQVREKVFNIIYVVNFF